MMPSQALLDSTLRNAIYLEGLKSHEVNTFVAFLKKMDASLKEQLTKDDLTQFSRNRLEKLLVSVEQSLNGIFGDYYDELAGHLIDLGEYESEFEARSLGHAISNPAFESVIPAPEQVRAAVFSAPLSVRGPDGGKLLEPFIKDWMSSDVKRVSGVIRQGFFEGKTNFQIIQAVRGTKAANYKDGALAVVNRDAEAIVRTAVQHTAMTARMQTWIANGITQYKWLSTLDGRTSTQCRALDQDVFDIGKGPVPPVHIRCRSSILSVLPDKYKYLDKGATRASKDGYVKADLSYYEWLKTQSEDFQDDVLGPTRAKLFRSGEISVERFKQLQLDKNFKPITLAEMRKKEPSAFKFVDSSDIVTEQSARQFVVENGRKYGGEFAYAGNPETGDFLFKKRGQGSQVSFTARESALLKRNPETVLYHNHPSGSSLSQADLEFTASHGIKEIVAFATRDNGEFRASTLSTVNELRPLYKRTDEYVRDRMYPLIQKNLVSIDDANLVHAHVVNTLLNKSGKINYKVPKTGDKMDKALKNTSSFIEEWLNDYDLN